MSKLLPRIDYYFDVISPYSWIGFEALHQLKNQWNDVDIKYIPCSLGTIMRESGNKPPAMVPNRGIMLMKDVERSAKYWGMNMKQPPQFMEWIFKYTTRDALILLLVIQEEDGEELMIKTSREMWNRLWWKGEKIFEDEDFVQILKAVGVKDVEGKLKRMKDEKYKNRLKENTNEAMDGRAYGAPWITVHTVDGNKHQFFGSDRFHFIAELLDQPQPLPDRLLKHKL